MSADPQRRPRNGVHLMNQRDLKSLPALRAAEPEQREQRFADLDKEILDRTAIARERRRKIREEELRKRMEMASRFPWLSEWNTANANGIHQILVDAVGFDFRAKSNGQQYVRPRSVAMWIMRRQGMTLPSIGRFYSQHHTTVLHAVEMVDKARANPELSAARDTDELLRIVRGETPTAPAEGAQRSL